MREFLYTQRVYYADTDAGGIVYHASYIDWAEHARTEMLRSLVPDRPQSDLASGEHGILIVVRSIRIDYRKPGYLDDLITVHTTIEETQRLSCTMRQRVMRGSDLLADLSVNVGFIDASTRRPALIPEYIRAALGGDGAAPAE